MGVMKSRLRMVTFRLSAEEHELMKSVCIASGTRSLSDFARSAVLHRARTHMAPQGLLSEDLATLTEGLLELDATLEQLRGRIDKVLGGTKVRAAATGRANGQAAGNG